MGRPPKTDLARVRTRAWFFAVSKAAGLKAHAIEQSRGGFSKIWPKYKNGQHVPNRGLVAQIELEYPGTKHLLDFGPANLCAAAMVSSVAQGYAVLKPTAQEERYATVNDRFLKESKFRGPPAKWISEFAAWLRRTAKFEPELLPLAVSANFVAMLCLDEYGLAEIIVDGAEAFETQYGIGLKDFLKVSQELYVTLAAALAEQGHRLPRSMCPI